MKVQQRVRDGSCHSLHHQSILLSGKQSQTLTCRSSVIPYQNLLAFHTYTPILMEQSCGSGEYILNKMQLLLLFFYIQNRNSKVRAISQVSTLYVESFLVDTKCSHRHFSQAQFQMKTCLCFKVSLASTKPCLARLSI